MTNRKLLLIALSLVLMINVALTVAYFTDYEDARGGAVVHLSGTTETEEHFDGNDKIVSINNTGDVDMLVRVLVFGDMDNMTIDPDGSADWTDGGDGAWYYTSILPAHESTSELKIEVRGRTEADDPIDFEITVVHESSRVIYSQDADGSNIVKTPSAWTGCPEIKAAE